MNKFIKLSVTLATVGLTSAAIAQDQLSETGVFVDGIAAVVNEGVVLKSELNRQQDLIIQRAAERALEHGTCLHDVLAMVAEQGLSPRLAAALPDNSKLMR